MSVWSTRRRTSRLLIVYGILFTTTCSNRVWSLHPAPLLSRRSFLPLISTTIATTTSDSSPPATTTANTPIFQTTATGRQEYTNAITASRDTNISPAEAYDVIRARIPHAATPTASCVDVGAGAGLSTSILYTDKGYRTIAAVDWSRTAWDAHVRPPVPATVQFYAMDDVQFFAMDHERKQWDCIVYNFAMNTEKAQRIARQHLTPSSTSVLLAPCNDRPEYWYKQSYLLLNAQGDVVWKSDPEVGAWSVQFQPDVTSTTCTGIWCGGFNGYAAAATAAKSSSSSSPNRN